MYLLSSFFLHDTFYHHSKHIWGLFVQDLGAISNGMFKLKGPAMLKNNYSPAFPLKHQQKDMRLALALGDENAVSMPVAAAANEVILFLSYFLSVTWYQTIRKCFFSSHDCYLKIIVSCAQTTNMTASE